MNEKPTNERYCRRVLICQGPSCRKFGSAKVLAAFQADPLPEVEIVASGCLRQCGNGPMVLVEPELVWYWRVLKSEVPLIIKQHLRGQHPVTQMLYRI